MSSLKALLFFRQCSSYLYVSGLKVWDKQQDNLVTDCGTLCPCSPARCFCALRIDGYLAAMLTQSHFLPGSPPSRLELGAEGLDKQKGY